MHFATGAMGALLPKLGALLLEEYRLNKVVKQGIKDLRDELASMQAALVKLSDVPLDQLDPQVKVWADDVRELSYAIEDSLDYYMVRLEPTTTTQQDDTFMAFIKKTGSKFTELKTRHKISSNIKDIEKQVRKVKERYDRYKVEDVVANIATTTKVDPRLLALYSNVSDLVGIDKSLEELMKRLSDGGDVAGKKPNTVSVVGLGGLGKTTLAKAVYGKLKKKFDCAGFVPVGQKPSMEKLLKDILYEFDMQKYANISASKLDIRQLIDEVQAFLANKRYLIVIDDIWDIQTWEIIKCALVDSNPGTRIITTTRNSEVAKRVGGVYDMKPLSEENSRKLFNTRIFGGASISPDNQPFEASDKILRKCGGVPLAIITIASLLVNKRRDEWSKVYDSIGFGDEENEAVQNTRKIISYSYYDLPSYLKSLILYVSIYQENGFIPKEQLIWVWVAEGFIPEKPGIGLFELGESYLNELINRSMIQLTEPFSRLNFCSVHDMVLDLMHTLSRDLNFVTIWDVEQQNTCSTNRSNTFHRLSIHKGCAEHNPIMEMAHVRSFIAIQCHDIRMPPLQSFKALRVLVLENCDFSFGVFSLKSLSKLLQLRYLGLAATTLAELPRKIGHLKLLQFLNIADSAIKELPSSVSELRNLMFLSAPQGIMRGEVGKLRSLEELCLGSVDKSPNFVRDLGELTKMRALRIGFTEMDESMQKSLVESLQKLRGIQILNIGLESEDMESEDMEIHCFHGFEEWAAHSELRQMWLVGMYLSRRPSWMDFSFVPHLSSLKLTVQVLEERDMQILGKLPSLGFLNLYALEATYRQSYSVASHEFKKLGLLLINIEIICEEGALPMLYSLNCYAGVGKDIGLVGNMPLLEDVTYSLHCKGCIIEEVEKAEEALRQAAETHPSHPKLTIQRLKHKEISFADVLMVGTYLKDVLHVSEEGSLANEEVSTVAYYMRVLRLSEDPSCKDEVLELATGLKAVLRAPQEVWATDKHVRAFAIHLKDKLHLSRNVPATDEEEVSLDDVRMVAAYLKDVLHVSEGASKTENEVLTVSYIRHILHMSEENSDEEVLKAAQHLKDVLHAPEGVWANDKLLRSIATYFMDNNLPVSTDREEISVADVHAAARYLKDVLHVSDEGSSSTGEDMPEPTVAYLRHVLFVSDENSDQQVLAIATHFRSVLNASEDVWASDQLLRSAAPLYKDKLRASEEVSDTDEEISLADVRAAATYLKDVLHVSEGPVSATIPTIAYLRHVLGLSEENSDQEVLAIATHFRNVLHASEDVWASDQILRSAAPLYKDKLPVSEEVSDTDEEEISLADVRAAATYLKDVLHVSEGPGSATDDEMPTVAYLRDVLGLSEQHSDERMIKIAAYFRHVLRAPEDVWLADRMLRMVAPFYKDKLPVSGEVSDTNEERSNKVEVAEDCTGVSSVVKTEEAALTQELDADLHRLVLYNMRDHD